MPDFGPSMPPFAELADGVRRIVAPNPSMMTGPGTNTYLVGNDAIAVIDPGPDDELHFQALNEVIAGRQVSHILVTHSHLDHSPLAKGLSTATGAKIYAFGPSEAGRSAKMQMLAQSGCTAQRRLRHGRHWYC